MKTSMLFTLQCAGFGSITFGFDCTPSTLKREQHTNFQDEATAIVSYVFGIESAFLAKGHQ
jgi:hypothetical protein